MPSATINRALTRNLPPVPEGFRKLRVHDPGLPGFILEVSPAGTATFWLRVTDPRGRRRELRLGRLGAITAEQARRKAIELRAQVTLGADPAGERDRLRSTPTFGAFVADRFLPHVDQTLRPATRAEYHSMCRARLVPAFGRLPIDTVTAGDVAGLRARLVGASLSGARVNRYLSLLRRIFSLAIRWEVLQGANPCRFPGMLPEAARERFLSEVELRALMLALDEEPDRVAASAIALLALTGARRSEILGARWQHLDLAKRILLVPLSKSGKRRHVFLSDAAVRVIEAQARVEGGDFLFPSGRRPGRPIEGVRGAWDRARLRAGLGEIRLHDLRHSFASFMINGGASLYAVGRALGHADVRTSARYAHLSPETLLDAANRVGRIAAPGR